MENTSNHVANIDTYHQYSPHYMGKQTTECKSCPKELLIIDINEFGDCWDCEQKYIKVGQMFIKDESSCRIVKIRYHHYNDEFVELPRVSREQLDNNISIVAYSKKDNKEIIFTADYFENKYK